ncbi:MAG: class D sortase [Gammaproteobacteria bacterium]|nr:MAG: class D sortase [Gammaproteobacteria bacterium]
MASKLLVLQRLFLGVGTVLLVVWAAAHAHRHLGMKSDLAAFEAAQQAMSEQRLRLAAADTSGITSDAAPQQPASESGELDGDSEIPSIVVTNALAESAAAEDMPPPAVSLDIEPDYSLWSPTRVTDYEETLAMNLGAPQALLNIPSIGLQVPVLEGIDEITLNRAVGRIPGTARPGGLGNVGISGHRDGFFRGLKDIGPGDDIEIVTWRERMRYEVREIIIVDKHEVDVLKADDEGLLTLVTCYPFYYVGHAPKRYIVRAKLADSEII